MLLRVESWTFDEVQDRLIEAMHLWARSPGQGRWPFALDAPWHLLTRQARLDAGRVKGMDMMRALQEDDERETQQWQGRDRPRPLSRAEVARRDEASEWLGLVRAHDRRVVVIALTDIARGRRVSWLRMRRHLGVELTGEALSWRYRQAIRRIAEHLTRNDVSKAA
jgi:hypothetical protein